MNLSNRYADLILWYLVSSRYFRQAHSFQLSKDYQKRKPIILAQEVAHCERTQRIADLKAASTHLEEDILDPEPISPDDEEWSLDLYGKDAEHINVEKIQDTIHNDESHGDHKETAFNWQVEGQRSEDGDWKDSVNGMERKEVEKLDSSLSQVEILTEQVQRQQKQIERLFEELKGKSDSKNSLANQSALSIPPLKAMLFIDGTWLYYSLYGREPKLCPIRKKYGHDWAKKHDVNWDALPRIICEALDDIGWSSLPQTRYAEIVRVMVFTSYKADTLTSSLRYQLFEEMKAAKYDVNQMETVGRSEKCVDIQLAVELLHYATIPDAFDVAVVLTGDKDFLPALSRTRQKGRKVALVSMRYGCNQALRDAEGIKE